MDFKHKAALAAGLSFGHIQERGRFQ
jgi:hypothetical protein